MDKVIEFSKEMIMHKKGEKRLAIDATCGRGSDTVFLGKNFEIVYAFDIQEEAIVCTQKKVLDESCYNVKIVKDSHTNFGLYINEDIDVVMFNLGFLPRGDKQITTMVNSTLEALGLFINRLKRHGMISLVCYPGHSEGAKEAKEIACLLETLDQHQFEVLKYQFINQINNPPFVYMIEKIG